MKHKVEQIIDFLLKNGLRKIRRVGDEFEFLTQDGQVVWPRKFFDRIDRGIANGRPDKIVTGHKMVKKKSHKRVRWVSTFDSTDSEIEMLEVKGYRNDEDKSKNEECNKRAEELNVWWEDLQELFNQIRFGVEKIPVKLAVAEDQSEKNAANPTVDAELYPLTKMSIVNKEKLYPKIIEDLTELHDFGSLKNWKDVYSRLSAESGIKYGDFLNGKRLSPGQIKGIHTNKTRFTKDLR